MTKSYDPIWYHQISRNPTLTIPIELYIMQGFHQLTTVSSDIITINFGVDKDEKLNFPNSDMVLGHC